jgi:kumamolisin
MTDISLVPLPGTERGPVAGAVPAGAVDESQWLEITILTRRMAGLPRTRDGAPVRLSRDELRQRYGSDPADQALVAEVLTGLSLGLEVTQRDPGSRRLRVAGPVSALARAFGAELSVVTSEGPGGAGPVTHRYRQGGLQVPAELDGIIVAVVGLDDRPQARSQLRRAAPAAQQTSYTPPQVAGVYEFPAGTDGTGQTIAIIELGGGYAQADLDTYFSGLGITAPPVTAVGVDGAGNGGGQDPSGADGEVLLDIEVAGSVAPGAAQTVYFAPNTDQGFIDAVTDAVHATPTPTAVSISWGQSEDSWTAQGRTSLDAAIADGAALGVTVCVAAGDNGSSDGAADGQPHCDFPASSPHALGCGGTSLQASTATGLISSETVWNDGAGGGAGGGGVSDVFGLPAWQATAGVPAAPGGGTGRGVPDVAGNADPATGYQVLVDGQQEVVGGTSAVAPLWAALTSRLAQATGAKPGFLQERLYAGVAAGTAAVGFRDITSGSNGAYSAGPGWDACTGLGSPDGPALVTLFSGAASATGTTAGTTGGEGASAGTGSSAG